MIKVAILGYGKMGKEIEKVVLREGMNIVARIDNEEDWETQREAFLRSDVPAILERMQLLGLEASIFQK